MKAAKTTRFRSSNWTESEKTLLKQLVIEKYNVIEKKDASRNYRQIKMRAWQEILQSFNEITGTQREVTQLINQWRNQKFIKKMCSQSCDGSSHPCSPTPENIKIMLKREVDENILDRIDSDRNVKDNLAEENSSSSSTFWTQMAQNHIPKEHNRRKTNDEVLSDTTESEESFKLAQSGRGKQIQYQQAEHEFKMKILQKEHEMKIKIMTKELEYWEKKLLE